MTEQDGTGYVPTANPWSTATSYLSSKSRPLPDGGTVSEANGWKVARLVDPYTATFSGYAFGRYNINSMARCERLFSGGSHQAPSHDCDCGFYALKSWTGALGLWERWRGMVILQVELYGTIVEHRDGWRAEEQEVVRIHVPARCMVRSCRSATSGFARRRRSWRPACGHHQTTGADLAALRRTGVDVVLTPIPE